MGRVEVYAKKQYELTGQQSWPEHPLSVLGRTRNIIVTYDLGIPDEDNERSFDGTNLYHRRLNNEIRITNIIPILFFFLNIQVSYSDTTDFELDLDAMWENTVWYEIEDVVDVYYEVEKVTPVAGVRGRKCRR